MGLFSTYIAEDGARYQFKTGADNMEEYRLGDAVPYKMNPAMALDVEWEDQICEGTEEVPWKSDILPRTIWLVIKDHRIKAVVPWLAWSGDEADEPQYSQLLRIHRIREPRIEDWDASARIAYHRRQIEYAIYQKAENAEIAKKHGEGWEKKPSAYIIRKLNQHGFARMIFRPVKGEGVDNSTFKAQMLAAIAGSQDGNPIKPLTEAAEDGSLLPVTDTLNRLLACTINNAVETRDFGTMEQDLKYAAAQLEEAGVALDSFLLEDDE